MIYTIGGVKGGTGKSTVATNLVVQLALMGRDALLIDADKIQTSTNFAAIRNMETDGNAGFAAIQLQDEHIRNYVRRDGAKYNDIVIDVGGFDSKSQRNALIVADIFITPFAPRSADIWAVHHTDELIGDAKAINEHLQAYTFINKADAQGSSNNETAAYLREEVKYITFIDTPIVNRKVFGYAMAAGQGVMEYAPRDTKAIEELQAMFAQTVDGFVLPTKVA